MMQVREPQTETFLNPSGLEDWVVCGGSQDLTLGVVELALDKQCLSLRILSCMQCMHMLILYLGGMVWKFVSVHQTMFSAAFLGTVRISHELHHPVS